MTTIKWNEQAGKTEIVHRLHSHDAELGVATVTDVPDLTVHSLEGQAQIALYVESRFTLDGGGVAIDLHTVGAELSDDHILVYQETPIRLRPPIVVRNGILRDAFPKQVNQVNITLGNHVRTLFFTGQDGPKSISAAVAETP